MNSLKEKLRQLETSELFTPDLVRQPRWTNAEWATLDPERREQVRRLIEMSWRRVGDPPPFAALIMEVRRRHPVSRHPRVLRRRKFSSHSRASRTHR